jgi:hypothetical protein
MDFPDTMTLESLETRDERHQDRLRTWEEISDFRSGWPRLKNKLDYYLPQRPGEDPEIYRHRIRKPCYTPVMNTAIREFTGKLMSSAIHESGADGDFWDAWFEKTDGKSQDKNELLTDIFTCLLYYGEVYLGVENPRTFQGNMILPYVLLYEPWYCTYQADNWYLTKQVKITRTPFGRPESRVIWTYWMPGVTAQYEAQAELGINGEVHRVFNGNEWVTAIPKTPVRLARIFEHGAPRAAMVHLELPEELWTARQAYPKQWQHMIVENAWVDSGSTAGVVQRIYRPSPPAPMDDPRVSYSTPDYSQMVSGNHHILIGDDFKFSESPGGAIANLQGQLDKIELQIKHLASMGWQSVDGDIQNASGASKAVDMALLEDTMKTYGKKVLQIYQGVLGLVSELAGGQGEISVTGLDTYGVDSLQEILEESETVFKYLEYLPETAVRLWVSRLSGLLAGSVSFEDRQKIQDELKALELRQHRVNPGEQNG